MEQHSKGEGTSDAAPAAVNADVKVAGGRVLLGQLVVAQGGGYVPEAETSAC
jgi:hypothetical protein